MIESLVAFLQTNILPLGFWGVFLASVIEEVVAPIPSALVMMMSGFLFVSGPIGLSSAAKLVFYVGLPAALGVTLGSLLVYAVAYWGGKIFLEKWGKWIGLYWADVLKMKLRFEGSKRDELAVISARVLPIVPSVAISAFCGFIRMGFWKYIALTFFGMFLRGVIMGAAGWQIGNVYFKYADLISKFENKVLWLIALLGVTVIIYMFLKRRKNVLPNSLN